MDGLVDAEPHNVREIISGQAVCLIFRVQVRWGWLLPPAVQSFDVGLVCLLDLFLLLLLFLVLLSLASAIR